VNGNGADALAHLVGRVDELDAAQRITARALEETWRPRLLELERDVEMLLELLGAAAAAAAERRRDHHNHTRAPERAQEGSDADHPD